MIDLVPTEASAVGILNRIFATAASDVTSLTRLLPFSWSVVQYCSIGGLNVDERLGRRSDGVRAELGGAMMVVPPHVVISRCCVLDEPAQSGREAPGVELGRESRVFVDCENDVGCRYDADIVRVTRASVVVEAISSGLSRARDPLQ